MKIAFTLLMTLISFFLFSQTNSNRIYTVNIAGIGSYTHKQKFQNPTGEKIPFSVGWGYKVGASVKIPKGKIGYISGLNFRQTYSYFQIHESMSVYFDEFGGSTNSVAIADRVRQSYIEIPFGVSTKLSYWSTLSGGVILQAQVEHCRHRRLYGVPQDASRLEPLATDINSSYLGIFLKYDNHFFIKNSKFNWEVFLQTNHDNIELPNTTSESEIQLYLGVGLNYYLNSKPIKNEN